MLKNPSADALQEITDHQWIDGEYLWIYEHNPELRKKYKKTKTAHIASHWFPTATFDRLKPICRLMLWTLYNDDLYEEGSPNHFTVSTLRSCVYVAIWSGEPSSYKSSLYNVHNISLHIGFSRSKVAVGNQCEAMVGRFGFLVLFAKFRVVLINPQVFTIYPLVVCNLLQGVCRRFFSIGKGYEILKVCAYP